ncbi:hypothetical protein B0H21DRAFT_716738 [Amylocystis lapponica]|nr:hypothetical protein B0H21DRAFT_716738 [Amylocystis lapponica]
MATQSPAAATAKIPLPEFLKVLTSNNVPATKAMAVASKIYKTYNTPSALGALTDVQLAGAGLDDKELRKLVLTALRKAGFRTPPSGGANRASSRTPDGAGPSTLPSDTNVTRPKRKRKRDNDINEFLPDRPSNEGELFGSLEFNEVLDEEVLKNKYTVVNRAPVMMAWAFIVAERLGFQREEALSIASVYTEMNAITKGVSLGIFDSGTQKGREASQHGSQPYVDLMGRRSVPLYQTADARWRALSTGAPVAPSAAFSYISRALRQTTPHVLGALRLLAASYAPAQLNAKGFALYADFRPSVDGWGKKAELRCNAILALRKARAKNEEDVAEAARGVDDIVKIEPPAAENDLTAGEPEQSGSQPERKRPRVMTVEEYEAALDADTTFDNVDLNFDVPPANGEASYS